MEGLFGIIGLACGVYCLYGYYMLKFKREISRTILLPKNVNIKKCKDLDGYIKEASTPLLILGVIVTVYGGVDLYNTYAGGAQTAFVIMFILVLAALVGFVIKIKKCNRKYFGI